MYRKQDRLIPSEQAVLELLREGPSYGYAIAKRLGWNTPRVVRLLRRLELRGLVYGWRVKPLKDGLPGRLMYGLTN